MQVMTLATRKKECFGLMSKYEIINVEIKLKTQILEAATKHA
jgi:hypothetical protein